MGDDSVSPPCADTELRPPGRSPETMLLVRHVCGILPMRCKPRTALRDAAWSLQTYAPAIARNRRRAGQYDLAGPIPPFGVSIQPGALAPRYVVSGAQIFQDSFHGIP